MGQMAGQSRQVVDNMVRATRMVVEYFRLENVESKAFIVNSSHAETMV